MAAKEYMHWSQAAKECYTRGGRCEGCIYKEIIKSSPCRMKHSIIQLVKNVGKPDFSIEEEEPDTLKKVRMLMEEEKTRTIKECAKILGINYQKLLYLTKKSGIKGRRGGNMNGKRNLKRLLT